MRAVSFNIQSGTAADGRPAGAELLAAAVAGVQADVVALQEVDRDQPRSGHVDQARLVAEAMGLAHHRFYAVLEGDVRTRRRAPHGTPPTGPAYGVALASRYPITEVRTLRLPQLPLSVPARTATGWRLVHDEPRGALLATLQTSGGPLSVCTTHLSNLPPVAVHQLRTLLRALAGISGPLLLCGDFNLRATAVGLLAGGFVRPQVDTFPASEPDRQIDYVLLRGAAATGPARSLRLAASDHRAIAVPVALDPR